ncbi:MAG TPA: ROK family protein [Flavobacteriales bacterium]|nr:ROK family protein [Flavobacteriales bacterium]
MKVVAGIDIGGTNTVIGLVNEHGHISFKTSVSTRAAEGPEQLAHTVYKTVQPYIAANNVQLEGIGIGAPNGNFYTGNIEFAPNLPWKGIVPLAKIFEDKFHVPVKVTNDANAAALGEMIFGHAKGMRDFIFITLGTGVGSGIVVNGQLVYGNDGFAGEIGHVIIKRDGRLCGCGRRGCVETYCSAGGIVKTYHEISGNKAVTDSKQVADMALAGDKQALETFDKTAFYLGFILANAVAYLSPKAIFIFGGPTNAGHILLDPLRHKFEENLLQIYKNKIPILRSGLAENDAAVLGAASLMLNEKKNNAKDASCV